MMQLQFADKMVTYETFITDVASRLASILSEDRQDKRLYISQAEAFRKYGRGNVERWRRQGKIEPRKTSGKLEYPQSILRDLSRNLQDYL
jgi:hypothetical protein